MIKLALLLSLAAGTAFYAGGRTTYSGIQAQIPDWTAVKVTPDPSNIWSFHQTVTVPQTGRVTVPVLVDFDNNKKMDTEHTMARVLITDMQVSAGGSIPFIFDVRYVRLVDSTGIRWDLTPPRIAVNSAAQNPVSVHLSTPLALPINSDLCVEVWAPTRGQTITINLIGRVVTM